MKAIAIFNLIIAATCVHCLQNESGEKKTPSPQECKLLQRQMDRDMYKILIMGDMRITSFSSKEDLEQRYCR